MRRMYFVCNRLQYYDGTYKYIDKGGNSKRGLFLTMKLDIIFILLFFVYTVAIK